MTVSASAIWTSTPSTLPSTTSWFVRRLRCPSTVSLLIDRILETSESAVLGFVPKAQPSLSDSTKSYREVAGDMFSEDVAKAQELLAEAGYPNGEGIGTIHLVVSASTANKDLAQALQSMWKTNLNVNIEIVTYESKVYWTELDNGNFDIDLNGYTCRLPRPERQPDDIHHRLQRV